MRKMVVLAFFLLCAAWAFAQTSPSQSSSPGSSQDQSATSSQSPATSGDMVTVKGCVSGSAGNYTLTDDSGNAWQLSGDTSKLSEHVGHTVQIKGTTSGGSSGASGAAGSTSGTSSASGGQTLNVSSVKHISTTCSNTH
jgi:hypothetical protein